jgi:NAD(P)-dependent dehydrogenase (short-subunit alcohol dehydrogenase family)
MTERLAGEVAIVTGSTSGIGRAIATMFAAEGASVVVTGRDAARGAVTVAACGARATFLAADLTDPDAPAGLVAGAIGRFGALTIVVNNAVDGGGDGPVETLDDERWARVLETDLVAAARLCRAAIAPMRASGHGAIVNISSRAGERGTPGFAAYSAAKGGLNALTRSLAVDYAADGIRANTISPGYVLNERRDADMTAERRARLEAMHLTRLGQPEDVAWAALYLASAESGFLTGINLALDGGSSIARATSFR